MEGDDALLMPPSEVRLVELERVLKVLDFDDFADGRRLPLAQRELVLKLLLISKICRWSFLIIRSNSEIVTALILIQLRPKLEISGSELIFN